MNADCSKITRDAVKAFKYVSTAPTPNKNGALLEMAKLLEERADEVIAANKKDMEEAEKSGIEGSLLARLSFDRDKIAGRVKSLRKIVALEDPVGQVFNMKRADNGLMMGRMRVPLGVILMIYEARPHVTVNAGAFALKSGNAIICKGGSEAKKCNALLSELWSEALEKNDLPADAVQIVSLSHDAVDDLLQRDDEITLVIPRGGKGLIKSVSEKSRIPVIKHYEGVCHVYVGEHADTNKALDIILDSKLLMPAVCNALESVVIDETMKWWAPYLVNALVANGVEVRACEELCAELNHEKVKLATEEDYYTEYLDKIISLRLVDDVGAAAAHITEYGSGHTDVIVTENYSHAQRFMREVDSSVVLVNASTMFCDGETLGMGAEIGISTDRLHARGPMGLEELTTYKHVIWGEGQTMSDPDAWKKE